MKVLRNTWKVRPASGAHDREVENRLQQLLSWSHGNREKVFAAAVSDALVTLEAAQVYLLEIGYVDLAGTLDGAVAKLENAAEYEPEGDIHEDLEMSLDDEAKSLYSQWEKELEARRFTVAELQADFAERAKSIGERYGMSGQQVMELGQKLRASVDERRARRNPPLTGFDLFEDVEEAPLSPVALFERVAGGPAGSYPAHLYLRPQKLPPRLSRLDRIAIAQVPAGPGSYSLAWFVDVPERPTTTLARALRNALIPRRDLPSSEYALHEAPLYLHDAARQEFVRFDVAR